MSTHHYIEDEWSIVEQGFNPNRVRSAESIFSLGNGAMGQRANFEENYSGESLQGSYIAGVYYPDKTKVGWWKNGYPEYFAKVLNAPNWIGIKIEINGENLDLNQLKNVSDYRLELNMKEGWLSRCFTAELQNKKNIKVEIIRFLSMERDEVGGIRYKITALDDDTQIVFKPFVDAGIKNQDSNWDENFWEFIDFGSKDDFGFIQTRTFKTNFEVLTFMQNSIFLNSKKVNVEAEKKLSEKKIIHCYKLKLKQGESATIEKFGGYLVSTRHEPAKFYEIAQTLAKQISEIGFDALLEEQKRAWEQIWRVSDIVIDGDSKAQQAVRYNIFQLNQTYTGKDPNLNIGPKGFTGEKYGGSTYWDTEAFCLPFYLETKEPEVSENLLKYRYNHLGKAIENAEKLGFSDGAALYPMVTMNGEECHNEWEITFEEIHRNGAIAFAIYNYTRFTGNETYIRKMGIEVLIGISRFWAQRVNFSEDKNQFVILGVTGPNEYENNVNNNFHTNYIAKWCLEYTADQINQIKANSKKDFELIFEKTKISDFEIEKWKKIAAGMYLPWSEKHQIYLQQDGFLDKELKPVSTLKPTDRPLNQKWSWDRILRSQYIKQTDTLQSIYFFEDNFSTDQIQRHFDFYEPLTVHESSLSASVHSVLASRLGKMEQAYPFFIRSARLDLDDYNKEVEEGLHITSMAGSRACMVQGFAGMRIKNGQLHFHPQIPENWNSYSFKINFRNHLLEVKISKQNCEFELVGEDLEVFVDGKSLWIRQEKS